jgi:putative CocE/NonD family hydrolase
MRQFYLDGNGDGHGVFRSGWLREKQLASGADEYVYDPLDLRRGEATEGPEHDEKQAGIDQSFALSIGEDGLVYHTEPFAKETEFIGCPKLTVWVAIDTPDTDLSADLYEIQPDGTSIALWSDVRRLRYRESLREAKLVQPGEIVRCDFAPGTFVSRRLMKGSRLRLVVTSPNSIGVQKNYNSGGVVADETAQDARTAHVKIFHGREHASVLQLPLR